jgi:hypothetical protein
MQAETTIIVQLSSIDELFVAPAANPFSTHEVDILGQAGVDVAQKQVMRHWPRLPRAVHLTVQLPPDQITPDLTARTCAAVQHYCTAKIDDNRLQRKLTIRRSLRQLVGAFIAILVALVFIAFLVANPFELIPAFLRGVLIVLALYACSVLSFDAVWSLVFDWVPFVQDNAVFRALERMDVVVEPVFSLSGPVPSRAN